MTNNFVRRFEVKSKYFLIILPIGCIYHALLMCAAESSNASNSHLTNTASRITQRSHIERSRPRSQTGSSSPVSHKRTLKGSRFSWHELPNNQVETVTVESTKQIHFDSRFLTINSLIPVQDERGKPIFMEEQVNLLAPDRISGRSLYQHFEENHQEGLVWILALYYFQMKDGVLARDYGDGRLLHRHLAKSRRHPHFKDLPLVGSPAYYSVEQAENAFVVNYLGTQETAKSFNRPEGILLRGLLELNQAPEAWITIGNAYNKLGNPDEALVWFLRALSKLQTNSEKHGNVQHEIGYTYLKKNEPENAEGWLKKALKTLPEEGQEYHKTVHLLGCLYEKYAGRDAIKGDSDKQHANMYKAEVHFRWALQMNPDYMLSLINLLCLIAGYDFFPEDVIGELPQWKQKFLQQHASNETIRWQREDAEGYARAYLIATDEKESVNQCEGSASHASIAGSSK